MTAPRECEKNNSADKDSNKSQSSSRKKFIKEKPTSKERNKTFNIMYGN